MRCLAQLACAAILLASPAFAGEASSRPGMGATVYQDDGGWGTTFRTWAPNADAIYVSGSFNGWSTNSHPLTNEGDNLWSLDVPGVWQAMSTSSSFSTTAIPTGGMTPEPAN